MRLFRKTREKFERIIREEVDEPRERQGLEVVTEAEDALRSEPQPARGRSGQHRRPRR
ncbi:MAG: hypothetical protein ACRDQB_14225 [Thermocrispum sp.]